MADSRVVAARRKLMRDLNAAAIVHSENAVEAALNGEDESHHEFLKLHALNSRNRIAADINRPVHWSKTIDKSIEGYEWMAKQTRKSHVTPATEDVFFQYCEVVAETPRALAMYDARQEKRAAKKREGRKKADKWGEEHAASAERWKNNWRNGGKEEK